MLLRPSSSRLATIQARTQPIGRTVLILAAHSAIYGLGISLGIQFGLEIAQHRVPGMERVIGMGICFLGQVILASMHVLQPAMPKLVAPRANDAEMELIQLPTVLQHSPSCFQVGGSGPNDRNLFLARRRFSTERSVM